MSETTERRNNLALRRRIDQLLVRVRAAEAEIVERGLGAVHDAPPAGNGYRATAPTAPTAPAGPDAAVLPGAAAKPRA